MQQSSADHGLSRLLHSRPRLRDNSETRILTLMTKAGFADAKKVDSGLFSLDLGMPGTFSQMRVIAHSLSARLALRRGHPGNQGRSFLRAKRV